MPRLWTLVLTLLCATAILAAQAPAGSQPSTQQPAAQQPSSPQPSSQSASSSSSAPKVTYTGCLKPGSTAGSWVLDSAEMAPPAGAAASTPGADRAVATAGSAKQTFALVAQPSINLTPHATHKIEVTGTTSPAAASNMSSSAASDASSSASASATAAPKQTLTIESFKMVAASCP